MKTEKFGYFDSYQIAAEECLTLLFTPSSRPLKDRWHNNGLSADFVGDYFTTFLPKENTDAAYQTEIKSAVSYIANELLENAMKFCHAIDKTPVTLRLDLDSDRILFTLNNYISPEQYGRLTEFLTEFCQTDPLDFFVQQMEKNAENGQNSGVCFVTMVNDYNAQLGWCIATDTEKKIKVTTQVSLPL